MNSEQGVLIPIDMLLNIDYGIVKTVGDIFKNNDLLDYTIYNYTQNQIVYLLLNRVLEDPLSLVVRNHNKALLDDIYANFTDMILKNSIYTNIINMIISTASVSLIKITIYCKNKQEEHFIREKIYPLNNNVKFITNSDISELSLSEYSGVYINRFSDLEKIADNITPQQQIYLLKTKYNLVKDELGDYIVPESIYEKIDESQLNLVVPYLIDDSYKLKIRE